MNANFHKTTLRPHSPVTDTVEASKRTVYISNLSYNRDRNGIRSMFAPFGDVQNIKIVVEPSTNQSRGMAFVELKNVAQAHKAIDALNGRVYDGRTLKANFAIPMRAGSAPKNFEDKPRKKDENKDLRFKDIQIAKKARNVARKGAKPPGFVG